MPDIDRLTGLLAFGSSGGGGGGGGTSGGCKFYECTEVGDVTWSGHEWLLADGVYSKSAAVTPGLAWTSVKPVVGKSYSADALIQVQLYQGSPNIPDMVFYAPLDSEDVQMGEPFSNYNGVAFVDKDGITCAKFTGYNALKTKNAAPAGTQQLTMSFWCKAEDARSGHWFVLGLGKGGYRQNFNGYFYDTTGFDLSLSDYEIQGSGIMTQTDWNFITMVSTESSIFLYINGKAALSDEFSGFTLASGDLELGRTDGLNSSSCYMAGLRIFTRALSASEITALYQEYAAKLRP